MLEKFNDLSFKDKTTVVCGIIVLIVIVFVLSTGFEGDIPKPVFKVDTVLVNSLIDDLGDNYVISISDTTGEKTTNHIHYYDGRLDLYESDSSEYGYLEYNGKRYQMDASTMKLTEYDGNVGYIDNPLYDYDLIKSFTDSCNYEYVDSNHATCKIILNEYLNYHNTKYNTSYIGSDIEYIKLDVYYGNKLNSLKIDYSAYNKFVNTSSDNLVVEFSFKYNSNNFDTIYDNYKDILGE